MSHRTLFAIVPLLLLFGSVLGLVLQDESLRDELVVEVSNLVPITEEGQRDLEDILTEVAAALSAIGLLSLFGLLWGASGMMGALRAGLNAALERREGAFGSAPEALRLPSYLHRQDGDSGRVRSVDYRARPAAESAASVSRICSAPTRCRPVR